MASSASSRVGRGLATLLGIQLHDRDAYLQRGISQGGRDASGVSLQSDDTFIEEEPTTLEFLRQLVPTQHAIKAYLWSLFPFLHWIGHYNGQWLLGDLVAGITIGAVVVPQGMSYATLAGLPVQFGLYSSFMGVILYWFFATSKDITIGPVAVMSQLTGTVVADLAVALPHVQAYEIASALAILAGAVVFILGILRLGWIVDLIPLTALLSFMTGSALSIATGQLPGLFGISGFSTRDATYRVFIHFLQGLPRSTLDAAIGVTSLVLLYMLRTICNQSAKRWPQHKRLFFFLATLRTVFVILLYTLISWLVNRGVSSSAKAHFKILGHVPAGFQDARVPLLSRDVCSHLVSYLPSTVIVLLIEHMAISKSFGRVNNYTINPSQEMVAIGVTNLLGPFVGGYASTGSFSRTAIKSKAGVRTPLAGVITAVVVLLAIYCLTAVFYYIPHAALSGVIIHAVGDLITPSNVLYKFWLVNPIDVIIFFAGVFVTVFSTIEHGIYTAVCLSFAVLLVHMLRTRGRFLGLARVYSVLGRQVVGFSREQQPPGSPAPYGTFHDPIAKSLDHTSITPPVRNVFLPLGHEDGTNPDLVLANPFPGIFIFRLTEGFTYLNAGHNLDYLTATLFQSTRRTNMTQYERPGNRPWNDPGPSRRAGKRAAARGDGRAGGQDDPSLPTLKAIILDFSTVNLVDVTAVQALVDVRNQLDRYTAPDVVDWHFAHIHNRWTKRALVSAGFGYPTERPDGLHHRWKGIYSVAEMGGSASAAADAESQVNEKVLGPAAACRASHPPPSKMGLDDDVEPRAGSSDDGPGARPKKVPVHGINRPLFHIDLTTALQSAIANVEARGEAVQEQQS